ncbi:hypothetical protein COHA_005362 [Chlorella ohadii]|uniref:Nitrate reductase [NADH] n=1 Tax=Chlorella ohadii TaxID=2649997 RepID=A0AAD5DRG7_9CHLO|nr:hypothetical protein COHA_005362 [Chlorella ohadii]
MSAINIQNLTVQKLEVRTGVQGSPDEGPGGSVDERDKGTPDEWIRRNPDMIRLTSKHPLNAEPPLPQLLEAGFHTPTALHYVRNHGAVPRIRWEEHRLEVAGLVERPCQLSMDELAQRFPQHSVLAMLSCAGNRRREVQLVQRTQGFAWGHSAIATSEWTGVPLRQLLLAAGVKPDARYIHFSGPMGEVAGGDGTYATSIPLWKGLDPLSEVVLAWKHNGGLLQPDHGYPLRVIIPGYIGGRCVKWLTRIELSAGGQERLYASDLTSPSPSLQDNKVLPSDVDQDRANKEDWWSRPEFVCYNLNIGSVIVAPAHDEVISLPHDMASGAGGSGGGGGGAGRKDEDGAKAGGEGEKSGGQERDEPSYTLRGFAHTGAGHLVIRAELSFDGGTSWHQAHIAEREPGVPLAQLAGTEEVRVRAWDDTMNTQPERPSWNLIGMMNNSQFIVKIRKQETPDGTRQLRFLHPVANGRDPGGWMVEEKQAAGEAEGAAPEEQVQEEEAASKAGKAWDSLRSISWDEIKQHTSRESCWFVRDGRVYDPTKFLDAHPGGPSAILSNAGQDASAEFDPIHSADARRMALEYLIGKVEGAEPPFKPGGRKQAEGAHAEPEPKAAGEEAKGDEPALQKGKVLKARLSEKEEITHDTHRFRFALPRENERLGLPVGHHITVTAQIKGEKVVRPYRPVTLDHERGYFDLVIKASAALPAANSEVYHAGEDPKHPEGGKMSQHMDSLKEGDTIDVRGPWGEFHYLGAGRFTYNGREGRCRRINLLGGGTGITPLYQVMRAIMEDDNDSTELCLLFANKTPQDVLLRRRLQRASEAYPNKVHIHYTVDRAEDRDSWHGSVGHISKEMLQASGAEFAFPPGDGDGGGAYSGGSQAAAKEGEGRGKKQASESNGEGGGQGGSKGGSKGGGEGHSTEAGGGGEGQSGNDDSGKEHGRDSSSGKEGTGSSNEQGAGKQAGEDGGNSQATGGAGDGAGGSHGGGTIALVCGPPPMVEKACLPALRELGFDEDHIIVF